MKIQALEICLNLFSSWTHCTFPWGHSFICFPDSTACEPFAVSPGWDLFPRLRQPLPLSSLVVLSTQDSDLETHPSPVSDWGVEASRVITSGSPTKLLLPPLLHATPRLGFFKGCWNIVPKQEFPPDLSQKKTITLHHEEAWFVTNNLPWVLLEKRKKTILAKKHLSV